MAVAAMALGAAASGCASRTQVTTATAASVPPPPPPTVAAGVSFHATLDGPLSSQHASAGDRVTATLDDPLYSLEGIPIVPAGAKLHGHLLEVGREGINRLVLQFDSVEFGGRTRALSALVTRVDFARVVPSHADDASSLSVDLYPILPRSVAAPAVGGGPPPVQLPVELDAGAGIRLRLSQPLVLEPMSSTAP
jgi:hypothetical protein